MNASYLDNYKLVIRGDSTIPSSLFDFAQGYLAKHKPEAVLELGSDVGQLIGKLNAPQKFGLEISAEAVLLARQKYPEITFYAQDVLSSWSVPADLMIDSHLYHRLVFSEERLRYLGALKANLKPRGRILIECMGKPELESYEHLLMNECGQIWAETTNTKLNGVCHMSGRTFLPFRSYFSALQENEIKLSGLTIHSLFYSPLSFEFNIMGEIVEAPLIRLVLG